MRRRVVRLRPILQLVVLALIALGGRPYTFAYAVDEAAGEATSCASSDFGYEVRLCLTAPASSVPLTGDTWISATVDVENPDVRIRAVVFMLDDRNILSDFDPAYAFTLPVAYWPDGEHVLSAKVRLSDDHDSTPVAARLLFRTGTVSAPTPGRTFQPTAGRPPGPGEPFVVAAVGDGAGGSPESDAVTAIIDSWNPNMLLYLGDVYNAGTVAEYQNWYAPDTSFGRFKGITNPTIGNHEYSGSQGPLGYMHYWGSPPHYYSVDANGWHIVSLDSNDKFNEIDPGSGQMEWLRGDLEKTRAACTLVFFHHPPFSVGSHGDTPGMEALWALLVEHGVTLVLTGHEHNYQRWQPLDETGEIDAAGTVSLVVGTGGQSEYAVTRDDARLAAPAIRASGALRLELNAHGASMQFVTTDGIVRDSSVVPCGGGDEPLDAAPPSAPVSPWATTNQDGTVTVGWESALDDTGVAAYDVYRGDELIGSVAPANAFTDAAPGSAPVYHVSARDAAGNVSSASDPVTPDGSTGPGVLFADDFAGGSLGRWSEIDGLTIERASDAESAWVARARGGLSPAFARCSIPPLTAGQQNLDLTIAIAFRVLSQGNNPAVLFRLRSEAGGSLFGISVSETGRVSLFNDVTGAGTTSVSQITIGERHELVARLVGSGGDTVLSVSLDGAPLSDLTSPLSLTDLVIGGVQLGDSRKDRLYDVQYFGIVIAVDAPAGATPGVPATDAAVLTANQPRSSARA
jgi:hypothetical protein